jgi:hypothetical protein
MPKDSFECVQCSKTFAKHWSWKRHQGTCLLPQGLRKIFECSKCEHKFTRRDNLLNHENGVSFFILIDRLQLIPIQLASVCENDIIELNICYLILQRCNGPSSDAGKVCMFCSRKIAPLQFSTHVVECERVSQCYNIPMSSSQYLSPFVHI